MWLITGPFDSEQLGDETSEKAKLLKPNHAYGVGRHKGSALTINNKKVSRHNGEFIVGEHSEDEASNTAFIPTLSLRNTKTTAMKVSRGSNVFIVNPESTYELESGDVIRLAGNVNATVTWDSKICYYTPEGDAPVFDLASCAAIGVKLVTKHSRDVTHHITARITTPLHSSMLLTLLNPASLVTPQWLAELVRRGQDVDGLEKTCDLPPERSYCPLIDPTVTEKYPSMAKMTSWNPKMNRKGLFDGVRFIFALIGNGMGSPTKAMSDIVIRGGADRQLINVEREADEQDRGASGTWGTVLKKRKVVLKEGMRSALVLVGDEETMMAKGVPKDIKSAWENMVEKARSVNMRVINPSLVAEAIFKADVSLVDCVSDGDTDADAAGGSGKPRSLPECIPSTLPEEASQSSGTEAVQHARPSDLDNAAQAAPQAPQAPVAGPSRRLIRRAASQTPVPELAPPIAQMAVEDDSQIAPKRLKRRANAGGLVNQLLGLDDTTVLEESQLSQEPAARLDVVPPTPARPGRLKRRAGTAAASQLIPELQPFMETREEPALKKFKALFEESGQGISSQIEDVDLSAGGDVGVADSQLPVVVEEEEAQAPDQAKKRKASTMEEEEVESSGDIEMLDAEGPPMAKKRAVEAVNAVERSQKPVSQATTMDSTSRTTTVIKGGAKGTKRGAVPGKPDTDPSFLLAIASSKRGKRLEDDFDREFNQLRIAKPVADTAGTNASNVVASGREWDKLDGFEDVGIRGNFMQIVELKVWKDTERQPERNTRRESGLGARLDWDGREDFKRFRRKVDRGSREVVKLVLSGQHDYEPDAPQFDYRGNNKKSRHFDDISQSESQNQSQSHPMFTQSLSGPRSRAKSRPKVKATPKVLYEVLEDDDDDEAEAEAELGGLGTQPQGRSQGSSRGKASQSSKKKQPLFDLSSEEEDLPPKTNHETLDNDSPDFTLSSSKGTTQAQDTKRKTRGTKRKVTLEEESDSDQGLTFGGFSKKAKRK